MSGRPVNEALPEGMTPQEADTLYFRAQVSMGIARIYDVLLSILAADNPAKAGELLELHAQGKVFYPAFGLVLGNVEEEPPVESPETLDG